VVPGYNISDDAAIYLIDFAGTLVLIDRSRQKRFSDGRTIEMIGLIRQYSI